MMLIDTDNLQSQRSFVRSLNIQAAESLRREADLIFAEAYVRVCMPNDLAISCMVDAIDHLRRAGLLNHGVKHHAMRAKAVVSRYEKALDFTLSGKGGKAENRMGYFMDMADGYAERMKPHLFRLRMALKNLLDRDLEPDSDAKSYAILANVMFHISVMQFDTFFQSRTTSTGVSLRSDFIEARLQGAFSAWRTAVEQIRFKSKRDPNEDPSVDLGVRVILRQINNAELINAAGSDALSLNPDIKPRQKEA